MTDPSSASAGPPEDGDDAEEHVPVDPSEADGGDEVATTADVGEGDNAADLEELRRQVEETYDFENFTPAQMREMSLDEWEAAFDADSWIVGPELLERVEADLKNRIASREVFAALEWFEEAGERRLLAYSDEGYAIVHPDGSVEGEGTVMRDVRPTVVLCSMEEYEVATPPDDVSLPSPEDVAEGTGQLGNHMLQFVAFAQLLASIGLLVAWAVLDLPGAGTATLVFPAAALGFFLIGVFLLTVVANARLSDRFRAEEFRNRLRAMGVADGERPDFLPVDPDRNETSAARSDSTDGRRRDPDGT